MDALEQAIAFFNHGEPARAETLLRRVLAKKPGDPRACALMGQVCDGRRQFEQAEHYYQRGLAASPESAFLWLAWGQSLLLRKRRPEALAAHEKAHALGHPLAALGLCEVLGMLDRYAEAVKYGLEAAQRHADREELYHSLGGVLALHGDLLASLELLREGVRRFPDSCITRSAYLTTFLYDPEQTGASIRAEHEAAGRYLAGLFPRDERPFANPRDPERPLRIGVMSSDFRKHAVASFIGSWLREHDRERYPVVAYHTGPVDAVTEKFRAAASGFVEMNGRPDGELVERIRADGIDVLVELNGHSPGTRLVTLLSKPAPVLATYLGYAATTGLPTMDYRIVDWRTDPAGSEPHASERLARLDRCFICFDPPAASDTPEVGPLPGAKPGSMLTVGSFSTLFKVSPAWLAFWGELLERRPGWRLVFKNRSLNDPATREKVRGMILQGRGPAVGDRLELLPATQGFREHLETYNRLDVALDVLPYHGTTTTCDALWMGVPTVTLAVPGAAHHARVGASLMHAVGLGDLVAQSREEFVEILDRLDADRARLAAIRVGLRERVRSGELGDAAGLARAIEGALRGMWRAYCAGELEERKG
jgi:protein O-GlcNAc transferase